MVKNLDSELLHNGRQWTWLTVDGAVYLHTRDLAAESLTLRLRSEPLHEEINMLKAFNEVAYHVLGEGYARTQGYESPAQLM
jgi:hypothetical protein